MVKVNMEYISIQTVQMAQRLFQIYNILIYTKLCDDKYVLLYWLPT
ncbi:hypothetical protein MuYL_0396 [Mucilaginibacter xinganensis]|uniref:Uncharacterized protein n=1 Tax=Mucilaginibacter xinganensis TaxID=1234841 RepID=A0A223NQW0_9SPHI|nr:hypothetical protein MuYL_0396 [Mucilaginibacter xinganensis]